ncbi:MAG TPA: hypothetical protein VGH20_01185 [Myxococcales bacterium]|jgi:uncharacterized protein involved in outer membrane biogenesis
MKILVRGLLGVLALVVIVGAIVYFNIDRIVKTEVEKQGTASLRLDTQLDSARLALFGGKVDLHGLSIASPKGFSAKHMLELGDAKAQVDYGELRKHPIHVKELEFDKTRLVVEQSGGKLNFKEAMSLLPQKPPDNKPPMKLVIDEIKLTDAHVIIRPGLPGISQEIDVPVPSLVMKAVGSGKGANNGAAIKDIAMQVITALAGKASQSDQLPGELKALMHLNTAQIATQLGAEAAKQIGANIPGDLGKKLTQDPASLAKDPSKALEGLFGGGAQGKAPAKDAKHR